MTHIIKTERAINIIISGNRDINAILNNTNIRYISYDGRITDINGNINALYMPIISDNFENVFGIFNNSLTETQKTNMTYFINAARNESKRLRFYGTPESQTLWQQMIELDEQKDTIVINSDQPSVLIPFLQSQGY